MERTEYCGAFGRAQVGREATVMGWVQSKRDMGGVLFLDLRDREGVLQVVCSLERLGAAGFALCEGLHNESVISARGMLALREEETYNPALPTGEVELRADTVQLLSPAGPLPFAVGDERVREELRLAYRYLDLRRPALQQALQGRHRISRLIRQYLDEAGFIEVETPTLTKSTPEGARDYLVPSRVHPGSFYALPQSPQIFKQLLMVGGLDKYYQFARCYRDEDLRADRQPEFTQVDMELSFASQEDILRHLEGLFGFVFEQFTGRPVGYAFPRLTWQQAMDLYGTDKPDLRFGLPIVDLTELAGRCGFSVFSRAVQQHGVVRAINVKGGGSFSRSTIEELTRKAQSYGAAGMAWIALREDGTLNSVLTKYFSPGQMQQLLALADARPGDFILFCAGALPLVRRVLGALRLDLGDLLGLRKKEDFRFLFVTDFPQFEWSQEEGRFVSAHHPFTMPYPEDLPYLQSDPARVRAQAYDLVLNGVELGSGSLRIYQSEVQQQMFSALGFSDAQIEQRFGFFLRAFGFGTPPHGGFAFGLDRLCMLLMGCSSLREVLAFPKIKDASCPLTQAPAPVDAAQLETLGLSLGPQAAAAGAPAPAQRAAVDVGRVARLARLSLSAQEEAQMAAQLEEMVAFAGQLSAVQAGDLPPTYHPISRPNVWREDTPGPSFPREALLQGAPAVEKGCLFVPKVVD